MDTSEISKSKISIKDIPIYVDLLRGFSAYSRSYSSNYEYLLTPIIPDVRNFLKKLKINYNTKKEKIEEILSSRTFLDRRYITLRELLKPFI